MNKRNDVCVFVVLIGLTMSFQMYAPEAGSFEMSAADPLVAKHQNKIMQDPNMKALLSRHESEKNALAEEMKKNDETKQKEINAERELFNMPRGRVYNERVKNFKKQGIANAGEGLDRVVKRHVAKAKAYNDNVEATNRRHEQEVADLQKKLADTFENAEQGRKTHSQQISEQLKEKLRKLDQQLKKNRDALVVFLDQYVRGQDFSDSNFNAAIAKYGLDADVNFKIPEAIRGNPEEIAKYRNDIKEKLLRQYDQISELKRQDLKVKFLSENTTDKMSDEQVVQKRNEQEKVLNAATRSFVTEANNSLAGFDRLRLIRFLEDQKAQFPFVSDKIDAEIEKWQTLGEIDMELQKSERDIDVPSVFKKLYDNNFNSGMKVLEQEFNQEKEALQKNFENNVEKNYVQEKAELGNKLFALTGQDETRVADFVKALNDAKTVQDLNVIKYKLDFLLQKVKSNTFISKETVEKFAKAVAKVKSIIDFCKENQEIIGPIGFMIAVIVTALVSALHD
ncbi:hypothetical protein HYV11_02435 [Candidatus Dependentiae bacterium]|nr:hypothetical protein [Candidatus Dependentiae bacterium]